VGSKAINLLCRGSFICCEAYCFSPKLLHKWIPRRQATGQILRYVQLSVVSNWPDVHKRRTSKKLKGTKLRPMVLINLCKRTPWSIVSSWPQSFRPASILINPENSRTADHERQNADAIFFRSRSLFHSSSFLHIRSLIHLELIPHIANSVLLLAFLVFRYATISGWQGLLHSK